MRLYIRSSVRFSSQFFVLGRHSFFYINMSHNSHSPREVFQSVHTDQALLQTFPNVYKLLYLMNIIPASVERSFSYMNLIKTPLRSRLTQRNLEALMRISMEGKDKLPDSDLDTLVLKFKNKKDRYVML